MRFRTNRRVVALLAVVAVTALAPSTPAHASPGAGTAVVSCTADFPVIPAVAWTNGGTCNGSAAVTASGITDQGGLFVIDGLGPFAASFQYNEPCLVTGQPAIVLSFAVGTFTATIPALIGVTSTWATVFGNFSWSRVGLNPVITLDNVRASFSNGQTMSGFGFNGVGTATFVPPGNFNPSTQLLCGQGGGPLTIPVVIAAGLLVS
ncbi:MAG TPA: hypothetical protein VGO92_09725 [Acidimicrobiales bacterium]|jgi:hypothetical protein|nr:hypothetical protein [Acidimicrobiales bacterium]